MSFSSHVLAIFPAMVIGVFSGEFIGPEGLSVNGHVTNLL